MEKIRINVDRGGAKFLYLVCRGVKSLENTAVDYIKNYIQFSEATVYKFLIFIIRKSSFSMKILHLKRKYVSEKILVEFQL
jgi:hypothetical protein